MPPEWPPCMESPKSSLMMGCAPSWHTIRLSSVMPRLATPCTASQQQQLCSARQQEQGCVTMQPKNSRIGGCSGLNALAGNTPCGGSTRGRTAPAGTASARHLRQGRQGGCAPPASRLGHTPMQARGTPWSGTPASGGNHPVGSLWPEANTRAGHAAEAGWSIVPNAAAHSALQAVSEDWQLYLFEVHEVRVSQPQTVEHLLACLALHADLHGSVRRRGARQYSRTRSRVGVIVIRQERGGLVSRL